MIKIKTRKIILDDILGREIIEVEALTEDSLPIEYLDSWDKYVMIMEDNEISLWNNEQDLGVNIFPGMKISETRFQEYIEMIKKAGTYLQEINESIKRKKWKGKETIKI